MFREIRRKDKELSDKEISAILEECTHGILSVKGDNGYPYGVPVSYVFANGKIYFHCAPTGHKLDAIETEPKVSFSIVSKDIVIPEKYSTNFASIIAFGKARVIKDFDEMKKAHISFIEKYSNDFYDGGIKYMNSSAGKMVMVEITIDHITGKGTK